MFVLKVLVQPAVGLLCTAAAFHGTVFSLAVALAVILWPGQDSLALVIVPISDSLTLVVPVRVSQYEY